MSSQTTTCPSCGSAVPANAGFCPECGHTLTPTAEADSPPETGESAAGSIFAIPMDPGMFATGPDQTPESASGPPPESAARTVAMDNTPDLTALTTQGGTPTVNIGQAQDQAQGQGQTARPAEPWQPGQYGAEAPSPASEQPASQPPAYSPYPMQPGPSESASATQELGQAQAQAPYAPPPGSQYGSPPQAFPQYGTPAQAQPPVQAYSNAPQPPINYQYQQQAGVAGTPQRDPTIALLLELLGYIGFLGIGHIYAGRVTRGVLLMIGWWLYWGVSFVLMIVLVGFCLALLGLAGPIASGLWIRNELEKENAMLRQRYQ